MVGFARPVRIAISWLASQRSRESKQRSTCRPRPSAVTYFRSTLGRSFGVDRPALRARPGAEEGLVILQSRSPCQAPAVPVLSTWTHGKIEAIDDLLFLLVLRCGPVFRASYFSCDGPARQWNIRPRCATPSAPPPVPTTRAAP